MNLISKAELVAQLEDEIEGIYGYPSSEYDYPWEVLVFKSPEEGEFNLENFLQYLGFLQPLGMRTSQIISQLKSATEDLKLPIGWFEGRHSIREYAVEVAETRELLIEKLLDSAGFIQTVNPQININLIQLLQENLSNLRQYIIRGFFIYIVGETPDGDWIGVSTKAVFT